MNTIPASELTLDLARSGCFVTGLSNADYHAFAGISKSGLDLIARSPAHYKARESRPSTRAMEIGSAIHEALLEPDLYAQHYIHTGAPNRTCKAYKDAASEHGGEYCLTADESASIDGIRASVGNNEHARDLLDEPGYRELSAFATDPQTGVLCKCRFDLLSHFGDAADVKSTTDCRPREFSKSVYAYRYHVQEAFYSMVYEWITGNALDSYRFIAFEKDAPYLSAVYYLDETARRVGRDEARRDLNVYAECFKSDDWPGYEVQAGTIGLPDWVVRQIENDMEVSL